MLPLKQGIGNTSNWALHSHRIVSILFFEFLQFRSEAIPNFQRMTTMDQARLNADLNAYLISGGIPDALKYPELPLLRSLYDDVLYRDIAARYRLEASPH